MSATTSEFENIRVLVVGLGESGYVAASVLAAVEASVVVIDSAPDPCRADTVGELERSGVEIRLGVSVPKDLKEYDLLVVSPGVPHSAEILLRAREERTRIISELELGYRLIDNRMIAVTGTNGKTTTTSMIASILDKQERRAIPCGNIGNPLSGLFGKTAQTDILVIEASSFQLENIEKFRAGISVALNIAPDHFDWHRDMDAYEAAKMRLVENQLEGDYLIYNADDEFCTAMAREAPGGKVPFGLRGMPGEGLWVEDGRIRIGEPLGFGSLISLEEIPLTGSHNVEDVMAASGAAILNGEDAGSVREAVSRFGGLEHRMEFAGDVGGVSFYNDSTATNPHAALNALKSFERPAVVIMGGRNKGLDFTELASEVCGRLSSGNLRGVILLGESADEIRSAIVGACPSEVEGRLVMADGIDDSVEKAYAMTDGARLVLFSPACASFDMFKDYAERGRAFKDSVRRLVGK